MDAQSERVYDEMERESQIAIMRENARRKKQPRASDLFMRPMDERRESDLKAQKEQAEHASEWLAQFDFKREEDDSL